MKGSITSKMYTLLGIGILMTVISAWSMYSLYNQHVEATRNQMKLLEIQTEVSALQGELWLYLEYKDDKSFSNLVEQQKRLSERLAMSNVNVSKVTKLNRLNNQLTALLSEDKQFQAELKQLSARRDFVAQRQAVLTGRYNMLIQNMYEYISSEHETELSQTNLKIEETMVYLAVVLVMFSVGMSFAAFMLLKSFRIGARAISTAINSVKKRRFSHRIHCEHLDNEFSTLGKTFNAMNEELEHSVFTKSQLENEVSKQTLELEKKTHALEYLSEHDSLTALLNRRSMEKRLQTALEKAERTGLLVALLFLDLDKFKEINDTYGHDIGDEVLIRLSERLLTVTRKTDIVSRFGGDEFVVCLDLLTDKSFISAKATQIIHEVERPIIIGNKGHYVGVSIGIAVYPNCTDNHRDLVKLADQAMYIAKERKGSHFVFAKEKPSNVLKVVDD
ncbi:diguanylate cyclase domain-containing protein [Vibrio sinaloensis]|uniref:diguanylate cyclase domain-containing protein n=1 Tax=Photobacterium sp. (strain ATCC 43367) TaxID=379097 RepID=UPI00057FAB2E|nr:diguanylate cyclase [Vibrio sinaloensis]KHT39154.1 diguanylate cyclase [Vibrio sinaloensis]